MLKSFDGWSIIHNRIIWADAAGDRGGPPTLKTEAYSVDNLELCIKILLTGFTVVFLVLLILIGIIKGYGNVIYNIQNKKRMKKASRNADLPKVEREPEDEPAVIIEAESDTDEDELIAVISAAVYSVYSPSEVRIKSVRRVSPRGSAWRAAGLSDNVKPF